MTDDNGIIEKVSNAKRLTFGSYADKILLAACLTYKSSKHSFKLCIF